MGEHERAVYRAAFLVLSALRRGPKDMAELRIATGLSSGYVYDAVKLLMEVDFVTRRGYPFARYEQVG